MIAHSNNENCVEEPVAPEWLSKLENRRESLRLANKLGHESGAGAPCGECGNRCPGLDLHFWRKVCRNCKCRKDQHKCGDDLSSWAQFEILGQICAKPAFIKINALGTQPLQLEWVPPNAPPDVVSDYMVTLGTAQVPITGSDAAYKRKQQLEFQVPPHDLDAALCDNLTETETLQLNQYVQKICKNCVGQGNVVRIGNVGVGLMGYTTPNDGLGYLTTSVSTDGSVTVKSILSELINSKVITGEEIPFYFKLFSAMYETTTSEAVEFEAEQILSQATKQKLHGLGRSAVRSLVKNGVIYDKILASLKDANIDVYNDPKFWRIAEFRTEYLSNIQFRNEILAVPTASYAISLGSSEPSEINSALQVKNMMHARFGAQMRRDTPLSTIIHDCGLPLGIDYDKDAIFFHIVHSEPLKQALIEARAGLIAKPVIITQYPMLADFVSSSNISSATKQTLKKIGISLKAIQSLLVNSEYYDALFGTLKTHRIQFADCKLLAPLKHFRDEILVNQPLHEELRKFVAEHLNSADITYTIADNARKTLSGSNSNDSGFGSKASTPNYTMGHVLPSDLVATTSQPKCDVNMSLPGAFKQLQLADETIPGNFGGFNHIFTAVSKCQDCKQPIHFGDVAVKAERAGKNIVWHPQCFKCHTCRELLADLVYFFQDGQIYCGRDLAINLKIPRCKACDELIFTKEYTAAEGETFHLKHFCCYQCDVPLAGQQYVPAEKSNMPLCLKCYNEYFAAGCQRCGSPIGPTDQGVAWGDIHWHGTCFVCAGLNCGKPLIGSRFCVKQKMPFCSPECVYPVISDKISYNAQPDKYLQ